MYHAVFNLKGKYLFFIFWYNDWCRIIWLLNNFWKLEVYILYELPTLPHQSAQHEKIQVQRYSSEDLEFSISFLFQYSHEPTKISVWSCCFGRFWSFTVSCVHTHLNGGKVPMGCLCAKCCVNPNPEQISVWLVTYHRHANMLKGLTLQKLEALSN